MFSLVHGSYKVKLEISIENCITLTLYKILEGVFFPANFLLLVQGLNRT
jgi:hypothetical protein